VVAGQSIRMSSQQQRPASPRIKYEDPDMQLMFVWINYQLNSVGVGPVDDIATAFSDGILLAKLIEGVTGCAPLKVKKNPTRDAYKLDNINTCLETLHQKGIDVRSYSPQDILEGNEKLVFGLVYKLMNQLDPVNPPEIYAWVESQTQSELPGVRTDGTECYQDGIVFAALVNSIGVECICIRDLDKRNKMQNLRVAFDEIQHVWGVGKMLQPENFVRNPDEERLLMYLSVMRREYRLRSQQIKGTASDRYPAPRQSGACHPSSGPNRTMITIPMDEEDGGTGSAKVLENEQFNGIEVMVKEAKGLKNMEAFGKMSPYTVIWVNFEPHEKSTKAHRWGGINPTWNEMVSWKARGKIADLRMKVVVWDKEVFGFDDYIGGGDFNVYAMHKGQKLEKWVTIMQHSQPSGQVLIEVTMK